LKRHYYIIKTARVTIPYVQPEMKFRSPPGQFHHEPPLEAIDVALWRIFKIQLPKWSFGEWPFSCLCMWYNEQRRCIYMV